MALDPSIILQARPVRLRDPLEAYGNALQLQNAQQINALRQQTMQQEVEDRARAEARRQGVNALLGRGLQGEDLERELLRGGYVDEALKIGKDRREQAKLDGETRKARADAEARELDTRIAKGQRAAQLLSGATDEQTWATVRDIIGREAGPDALANIPPAFNPQVRALMLNATMTQVQRLEAERAGRAARVSEANQPVMLDAQGRAVPNQVAIGAKSAIAQAGTPQIPVQIVPTADGLTAVQTRVNRGQPEVTATPVVTPAGQRARPATENKPPTEGQSKAVLFGSRMEEADKVIRDLTARGVTTGSLTKQAVETVPVVGGALGMAANFTASNDQQAVEQAQRDFINAVLRRESGAVIADSEFANARRQYFPQPGDSPQVIAQKARNRRTAIEGIKVEAGPHWRDVSGTTNTPPVPRQSATPAASPAPAAGGWKLLGVE